MPLPIAQKLGRQEYIDVANLQDLFVDSLYAFDKDAVLHGGTAIWRCYGGNRFSYDLDFYITSKEEAERIRNRLTWELQKRGANLDKLAAIDRFVYATVSNSAVKLKAEMKYETKRLKPIVKEYERADGTLLSVLTLSPEQLILEKIAAYESRRYVRDLYDIYHLLHYVTSEREVKSELKRFLDEIEPPVDEKGLAGILLSGVAPSYDDLKEGIEEAIK
ncbi:MAG: nucleotidyl transferase AbiEii/AbiGii toxin family protein [Candidatus Micrarchaeia archaeon]